MTEKDLLTRREAAQMLGLKASTLAVWAMKEPPKIAMIKMGSRVMYKKSDLEAFIEKSRIGD